MTKTWSQETLLKAPTQHKTLVTIYNTLLMQLSWVCPPDSVDKWLAEGLTASGWQRASLRAAGRGPHCCLSRRRSSVSSMAMLDMAAPSCSMLMPVLRNDNGALRYSTSCHNPTPNSTETNNTTVLYNGLIMGHSYNVKCSED